MTLHFQKVGGEWVVYGPKEELQLGEVTVQKRRGGETTVVIDFIQGGYGYLAPRVDAKTYRERREAKADRLRGWADKRQTVAEATLKADEVYTSDHAFNTQPGHIPIREKVIARDDRAYDSLRTAGEFRERADSIEAAAAGAIYSDDPDAIEQLRKRIAGLEAERDRIKAYNASCRKGARDLSLLDAKQQRDLASVAKHSPYQIRENGAAPAYWAANLSGNIGRQRKRLALLERRAARREEEAFMAANAAHAVDEMGKHSPDCGCYEAEATQS